ncbi:MAG: HAD-IIB family hydrolase [Proteobacteria bacterium]|nr:HAD-IIB family hydrolase [Pseudomonadota bacterium]NDD03902.1 HAD-IIB family hydrolase [Pseudomonadota bacterium]NDG26277.1 HAD-IIB family hydrolase [Pseudomonadota bacterium]
MLIVSDLDGTLVGRNAPLSAADRQSFLEAKTAGAICAIATGRSLLGVQKEIEPNFPLDYLIFSSGAGIYDWKSKKLLRDVSMGSEEVLSVYSYLSQQRKDFTIQLSALESHRFFYTPKNPDNQDFMARLDYHAEHGTPLDPTRLPQKASEFIIIQSQPSPRELFETLHHTLTPLFNVVRATSPFDGRSLWIEVFHPKASKAHAAEWIRERHQIPASKTFAIGNDYNDLQLLTWAGNPVVVGDAAPELLAEYPKVRRQVDSAFTHAWSDWKKVLCGKSNGS